MTSEIAKQYQTSLIDSHTLSLALYLSKHNVQVEAFLGIVANEINKSDAILEIAKNNPESLTAAVLFCAEIGLSPSSELGEFYFVPDGGAIKPIIGYKGLCALLTRSGNINLISAETVHRGDVFEWELGLEPKLIHKPDTLSRNSSTLTHIYCIARMANGEKPFKVISVQELRSLIETMPSPSALYFNDLKDPMMWMLKKTVIKQLAKLLPKDYYSSRAIAVDDNIEGGASLILDESGTPIVKSDNRAKSKFPKKKNLYSALSELGSDELPLSPHAETPVTGDVSESD
jgi:recombination protein RecT